MVSKSLLWERSWKLAEGLAWRTVKRRLLKWEEVQQSVFLWDYLRHAHQWGPWLPGMLWCCLQIDLTPPGRRLEVLVKHSRHFKLYGVAVESKPQSATPWQFSSERVPQITAGWWNNCSSNLLGATMNEQSATFACNIGETIQRSELRGSEATNGSKWLSVVHS